MKAVVDSAQARFHGPVGQAAGLIRKAMADLNYPD
jgi:hypothetical protein